MHVQRLLGRTVRVAAPALLPALLLAGCGDGNGGGGKTVTADGSVTIEAGDIYFDVTTVNAQPGDLSITLKEVGVQSHTLLVEGIDGFKLAVNNSDEKTSAGSVTLETGTYTYYCDVPGHRAQGMEGELVVE